MDMPVLVVSKDQIRAFSEEELRQNIIIPLMIAMGYRDAYEFHGSTELGKDVVGSRSGDFGELENVAVVAKRGRISGKVESKVKEQVRMAFNTSFPAQFGNDIRRPNKVWIVTNDRIPPQTRDQILSDLGHPWSSQTIFVDLDKLWVDWRKYFPIGLPSLLEATRQQLREIESPFTTRVWTDGKTTGLTIGVERSADVSKQHVEIKGQVQVPNSVEGRSLMARIESAIETGSPVSVPGEFFQLDFQPAMRRVFEQSMGVSPGGFASIEIAPIRDPKCVPIRLELICDDGDSAILDYVDFHKIRQGTKETTFSNAEQPIPILVTFSVNFPDKKASASFELADGPIPASWLLKWCDIRRCFVKPGLSRMWFVESGARWDSRRPGRSDIDFAINSCPIFIRELARAEGLVGRPIFIPVDEMTPVEHATYTRIRQLVRNPTLTASWSEFSGGFVAREAAVKFADCLERVMNLVDWGYGK